MARIIDADKLDFSFDRRCFSEKDEGYVRGADDAIGVVKNAPTIPQPTGWISVKDRLPKTGTVLVTDGRVVITAPSSSVTADGPSITHWMPLPELPGKEK